MIRLLRRTSGNALLVAVMMMLVVFVGMGVGFFLMGVLMGMHRSILTVRLGRMRMLVMRIVVGVLVGVRNLLVFVSV